MLTWRAVSSSGEWLSAREAAGVLGVSQWTLRRWAAKGFVPGYRAVGVAGMRSGQLVFSRLEIERLLAFPVQAS